MRYKTQWWDFLVSRHRQKRGWSGFGWKKLTENAIYMHLKHHLTINTVYTMILRQNHPNSILKKHNSHSTLCWLHWSYNNFLGSLMRLWRVTVVSRIIATNIHEEDIYLELDRKTSVVLPPAFKTYKYKVKAYNISSWFSNWACHSIPNELIIKSQHKWSSHHNFHLWKSASFYFIVLLCFLT